MYNKNKNFFLDFSMCAYTILLCILDVLGKDEVDAPVEEDEEIDLCTYVFIDSRDQLLLNFSPQAIDVITEVYEASQFYPPPHIYGKAILVNNVCLLGL